MNRNYSKNSSFSFFIKCKSIFMIRNFFKYFINFSSSKTMSFDFTSMKCGFAPQYVIAFTDPIKVRLGNNTSSFSLYLKLIKITLKLQCHY